MPLQIHYLNAKQKIKITENILVDTGVDKNKIAEMITIYNKIDLSHYYLKLKLLWQPEQEPSHLRLLI